MPFEPGSIADMLGNMFLPNTYGPGAGPPAPQGAPNPMTPPLWRPQNNLDDPMQNLPYTPPPTMPPPEQLMQRGPAPVLNVSPEQVMQPLQSPAPAPVPPATPPGGGIMGMVRGLMSPGQPRPPGPDYTAGRPQGPAWSNENNFPPDLQQRLQAHRDQQRQQWQPTPPGQPVPPVAPKLPMTPPGGGIQGMINHPFVQSILADPRKMQAAMQTPAAQSMLQDPRAMAYLQQMLQGR